ncbi:flagellar filament capping protein FliD [Cellulomonas hominis]|uniref:flagellar filament capping protein FliD n=1 Tax=Cellulomonas hominis TaxID=156981 RepID=UPI001C0F5C81|nr:flagellar filament capping protein FliD [Cellulomonas hominis]MBU5423544.1 flagellar filament capping protein FliD [Cellulomonas hominis]
MTSSIGIDGLISGLDTTAIIDKLMAVEANQQKLLATKKSGLQSVVTALQSLNTKVASLGTAATAALKAESWQAATASSSSTAVTAVTSEGAQPASLSFTVDKVAASQSTLYSLPAQYTDLQPSFTITRGGETTTITALSSHIGDIVAAFNAEGTGVTASAVNVGTAAVPVYKLQLTGTETGAANTFTVAVGNAAVGESLTSQELRAPSDAQITLFPGTPGATPVISSTNTFAGLLTGVDVTVSAESEDPVTVTVTRDAKAMSTLAQNLVTNLNVVLSEITSRTTSGTGTAADGSSIVTAGLLSGDTTIRLLQQQLLAAGSTAADGTDVASIGIVLGKDGTFSFDAEKFAAAYAADPSAVQDVVQKIAGTLETAALDASDATDGTLTTSIKVREDEVKDLTDRIASWDDRLATRRAALVKTYAAMEVAMSQMQSTSNFLTQQLAQLNANNASS